MLSFHKVMVLRTESSGGPDGEVDDSVELFGRSLRLCSQRLLFVTAHSTRSSARILHAFEN